MNDRSTWNTSMETITACFVCQGKEFSPALEAIDHTVSREPFFIQRCIGCGFHFTSPRPTKEHIGKYYLSQDYISHVEKPSGFKDQIYHIIRRKAIRGKHALISKYKPSGAALDIGCGTGDFLAYMQSKGYSAQGVEVSAGARQIATAKGVAVYPELNRVPPTPTLDVVTLWHVLEHVPDPRETLMQILSRMLNGGLLVIAVPDRESRDCQHYGTLWAAWDVPRHLSHFRRKDIGQLLKLSGFELLETRKMWFDAPYVSMLSEKYHGAGPLGSFIKGALFGLWSNLVSALGNKPTSSSLYIAQKP